MLRAATEEDFDFLRGFASEPGDAQLRAQIRDGRLRIIEPAGIPVGFIKFYVLWETLPFIEVIILREDGRGRGLGREAVRQWEREMAGRSFTRAVISTPADETAQGFWRRIGYCDCGSLNLSGRPIELFMSRDISATAADPDSVLPLGLL
jgi:ribosomal protein S18 acetylase RimI-like enzyme